VANCQLVAEICYMVISTAHVSSGIIVMKDKCATARFPTPVHPRHKERQTRGATTSTDQTQRGLVRLTSLCRHALRPGLGEDRHNPNRNVLFNCGFLHGRCPMPREAAQIQQPRGPTHDSSVSDASGCFRATPNPPRSRHPRVCAATQGTGGAAPSPEAAKRRETLPPPMQCRGRPSARPGIACGHGRVQPLGAIWGWAARGGRYDCLPWPHIGTRHYQ